MKPASALMTIDEVAERIGLSPSQARRLAGILYPARRIGRRIVVHRPTFEAWATSPQQPAVGSWTEEARGR